LVGLLDRLSSEDVVTLKMLLISECVEVSDQTGKC
jgi:hypothetical protein